MKKDKISIIGQCYNEEEMLPIFYDEICKLMKKMDYVDFEIIFIDDASKDKSLEIIKKIAKKDKRIRYISMSRNFGKEACAMAGFEYSTGDFITTIDLDLQDPLELLIEMYDALTKKGYDIAATKTISRKGYSKFHEFCTKVFYNFSNKISSVKMIDGQRDYRLMTRQVINAVLQHKEYNLFNKGLLNDVGFKIKWIEYENIERKLGKTKFFFKRLLKYALTGIIDYSLFPLNFILYMGIFLFLASILLTITTIILICFSVSVNFTILILSIVILFLAGIQMLCMGIMSLYISQIHLEVKRRPLYIIKEKK